MLKRKNTPAAQDLSGIRLKGLKLSGLENSLYQPRNPNTIDTDKPGIKQIDWNEVLEPIFPTDVVVKYPDLVGLVGEAITNTLTRDEPRLNSLGLEMHPLEIEVDDMLLAAKEGRTDDLPPKYKRGQWENPLAYLKDVYGQYLAVFNETRLNYLFQFQLKNIDGTYYRTLQTWLWRNRNKKTVSKISDYIPTKSEYVTHEIENFQMSKEESRLVKDAARIKKARNQRNYR